MAVQIISSNTIVPTGPAVSPTAGDQLYIVPGVTVAANAGDAIESTESSIVVQVAGSVIGSSAGIRLGDDGTDAGYRIEVAATGYLSGGAVNGTGGVRVFGRSAAVVNNGVITGYYGVVLGSSSVGTASEVFNAGTITGTQTALLRVFGSVDTLRFFNTGAIVSGATGSAMDGNSTDAVEEMLNRGTIFGDLKFGLGADLCDNRDGRIEGDVDLGDGVDSFDNLGGVVNGTVLGGAGNDTFRLGASIEIIDGGADIDAIDFRGTPAVEVSLDGSVEGTGNAAGDDYTGVENIYGSYYADLIVGGAGANTLRGYGGNDVMNGGLGGDKLVGGNGVDTITGGAGSDTFVYDKLSEIGDLITDFNGAGDLFNIRASAFGGGLVAGTLGATLFQSRADNAAQDADDRFIFRTTDRTLWFDVDGNAAGAAVMVADLQAGASLSATNIVVI